jgi:hypothetical protein
MIVQGDASSSQKIPLTVWVFSRPNRRTQRRGKLQRQIVSFLLNQRLGQVRDGPCSIQSKMLFLCWDQMRVRGAISGTSPSIQFTAYQNIHLVAAQASEQCVYSHVS